MKPLANPLGDLENMVKDHGKLVDDKLTGHTTEIEDLKARVKALEEKNAGATAEVKGGNDVEVTEGEGDQGRKAASEVKARSLGLTG